MDDFDALLFDVARGRLAKIPGAFLSFKHEYENGPILGLRFQIAQLRTGGTIGMMRAMMLASGGVDPMINEILRVVDGWVKRWPGKFAPLEIEQLTKKSATKKPSLDNLDAGTGKKKPGRPVSPQAISSRIGELKEDAIKEAKGIKKRELRTVDSVARKLASQDKWPYTHLTIKPFLRASWWN